MSGHSYEGAGCFGGHILPTFSQLDMEPFDEEAAREFFNDEELHERVRVVKLPNYAGPEGPVLVRSTSASAGVELYASQDVSVMPGEQVLIPTGLRMALPSDMEFQVRSKSGRTVNERLVVSNSPGTVDGDYRGEVCVIVQNLQPVVTVQEFIDIVSIAQHGWQAGVCDFRQYRRNLEKRTVRIEKGQKLAQGVFAYYASPVVDEVESLEETERTGGFGSTGLTP